MGFLKTLKHCRCNGLEHFNITPWVLSSDHANLNVSVSAPRICPTLPYSARKSTKNWEILSSVVRPWGFLGQGQSQDFLGIWFGKIWDEISQSSASYCYSTVQDSLKGQWGSQRGPIHKKKPHQCQQLYIDLRIKTAA